MLCQLWLIDWGQPVHLKKTHFANVQGNSGCSWILEILSLLHREKRYLPPPPHPSSARGRISLPRLWKEFCLKGCRKFAIYGDRCRPVATVGNIWLQYTSSPSAFCSSFSFSSSTLPLHCYILTKSYSFEKSFYSYSNVTCRLNFGKVFLRGLDIKYFKCISKKSVFTLQYLENGLTSVLEE